jgi:protease-4
MKKASKKVSLGLIVVIALAAFIVLISLALLMSSIVSKPGEMAFTGFGEKIAVIPVKGVIAMEEPSAFEGELGADGIVDALEAAENDVLVSAIVLEINSGGGSVVASRYVNQKVRLIEKPVVAYISEVGASAAYHVASSADIVVADPDSLTGSIGVIAMLPNLSQLLENWGVEMEVMTAGEFKDMSSMYRALKPEEREIMQTILDEAFYRFKSEIKEYRQGKLQEAGFEAVADGRLLSGRQAFEIGMVDELGTKQDALDEAAGLAGIEDYVVEEYGAREIGLFDLLAMSGTSIGQGFVQGLSQPTAPKMQS